MDRLLSMMHGHCDKDLWLPSQDSNISSKMVYSIQIVTGDEGIIENSLAEVRKVLLRGQRHFTN